jgi:acetylornithine deacetylase/succinyl-diaminopimelate desuccinylase-like protein
MSSRLPEIRCKLLDDLYHHIESAREEIVGDLCTLIRQPSISSEGIGLNECAHILRDMMVRSGIRAELSETSGGPPIVYGEVGSRAGKRTLICYAHYDVQPPDPVDEWKHPPFEAVIEDSIIYGRGATDNKGGIIAFVKAAEALLKTNGDVPVNLKFVFEGEEEIGSPHLEDWVIEHSDMLRADGLHSLDGGIDPATGRPRVALGNKAILKVELTCRGPASEVHSNQAAWVVNPAWRLVWALSTLKNSDERILIDGWYDPLEPLSQEDITLLHEIEKDLDEAQLKKELGIDRFLLNRTGFELVKERYFGTTCTINGISSGYVGRGSKTIIPSTATATLDFRCPPPMDPKEQLEKLKKHLVKHGFGDIKVKASMRRHPWTTSLAERISKAVISAAEKVFGTRPVIHGCTAEGFFRYHIGVPAVLTGFGPINANIHAPNENMPVDYLLRGVRYAAAIMQEFSLVR